MQFRYQKEMVGIWWGEGGLCIHQRALFEYNAKPIHFDSIEDKNDDTDLYPSSSNFLLICMIGSNLSSCELHCWAKFMKLNRELLPLRFPEIIAKGTAVTIPTSLAASLARIC